MPRTPLPAKLIRPRLYGAASRTRLFDRLDAWRDRPLVWVAGPPGAGKTTLTATYLAQSRSTTLWYRLDEGDADAATFFSFLSQVARSGTRRRLVLPALTPEYLMDLPGFTRRYFRMLFERLPEATTLVLDAYEAVLGSPIDDLLGLAIAEIPPGVRVIVTSREAPPPALAHLETKGQLGVVSWDALRLTEEEAVSISRSNVVMPVAEAEVERLRRYADGWAAGFIVVLDHVRRKGPRALSAPGTVRESLFAYFVNEMFAQADTELRELLLHTALMPGFTAEQAQSLCPGTNASVLLERLYRRHYFLDRSMGVEPVYRYHALFQSFLDAQGRAMLSAADRKRLLGEAARLMEAADRYEDAVDLYTQAHDWVNAERLICVVAPGMLRQGRNAALARDIDALPQEVVDGSAWLQYWLGSARMLFDPPAGCTLLETAYERFNAIGDQTGCVLACAGLCELYYLSWSDMRPFRIWAHRLDEHQRRQGAFPSQEMEVRVLCALSFYFGVCDDTDVERLHRWNARAVQLALEMNDPAARIAVASSVCFPLLARGDWQTLRRVVAAAGRISEDSAIPPIYGIMWRLVLCWMNHQQGAHSESRSAWEEAAAIAERFGIRVLDVLIEGHGAYSAINARDLSRAEKHIARMAKVLDPSRTLDSGNHDHAWSLLLLERNEPERAATFARASVDKTAACGTPLLLAECRIGLASALIELKAFDEALDVAQAITAFGESAGFQAIAHSGLMLWAGASMGLGRIEETRQRLRAAMALARACGIGMMFPTAPTRFLQQMFQFALTHDIERSYVCELISMLRIAPPDHADEHWPWPVRILTLGRFDVQVDGMEIEHRRKLPKKPLALLKFLLARRGEVRVEQAIDALWPEEEADAASNALDAALHRLRRLLGSAELLTLHDGHLRLNRRLAWIDAIAFEEAVDAMERSAADGTQNGEAAVRLYRGHFLAGDREEPWAMSIRERLRSRYIKAVLHHGQNLEKAGEREAARAHYERAIDTDELIEAFHQGLMRCQLALNERSEGLATYRRLQAVLRNELDLSPTEASEQLHRSIRSL